MKKVVFTILAIIALAASASAQNALGARINVDYDADLDFGAELSYQHGFSDNNRLELDFGWLGHKHHSEISATGIYQWTFNIVGNFGWFIGVGGNIGIWTSSNYTDVTLSVCGQGGIEYKFDAVPLRLSLDYRPMAYLIFPDDHYGDVNRIHFGALAFGVRYCF